MVTPGLPSELGLQAAQDMLHRRLRQVLAVMRDEERCRWIVVVALIARLPIQAEFAHRALMQWQTAGLVELGLAYRQRAGLKIDIAQRERQRLGHSEPDCGNQPEQGAVRRWPQAPGESQLSGGVKQRSNLGRCVNVRRQTTMSTAKNALGRDLCRRLELPEVRGERSHALQPACCCHRAGAAHMFARPSQHQFLRQRAGMCPRIGVPGEAHEFGGGGIQREAQAPTIVEVTLHGLLHRAGAAHDGLPGQGMATALSRPRSTLA